MRILVVNPNTNRSMTERMRCAAATGARAGTEILAVEPTWGPEGIEGYLEAFIAASAVLERLATLETPIDGVVLAGFGLPGREGARELLDVPVVDIVEASAFLACLLGHRFGVATSLDRTIPWVEASLAGAGVLGRCAGVRATGVRVSDVEHDEDAAVSRLADTARLLLDEDRAEVVCLGSGSMAGLAARLQEEIGAPVVDGIPAAVGLVELCRDQRLSTSKVRTYAPAQPKRMVDWPRGAAPQEQTEARDVGT